VAGNYSHQQSWHRFCFSWISFSTPPGGEPLKVSDLAAPRPELNVSNSECWPKIACKPVPPDLYRGHGFVCIKGYGILSSVFSQTWLIVLPCLDRGGWLIIMKSYPNICVNLPENPSRFSPPHGGSLLPKATLGSCRIRSPSSLNNAQYSPQRNLLLSARFSLYLGVLSLFPTAPSQFFKALQAVKKVEHAGSGSRSAFLKFRVSGFTTVKPSVAL
jgi:hypothetical protein